MPEHVDPAAETMDGYRGGDLEQVSAVDLADLLLLSLAQRHAAAVLLAPASAAHHSISLELGSTVRPLAPLSASLGDAVVARLALLAELDIASAAPQIGRVRAALSLDDGLARVTDVLVALRSTPAGLVAEMRRIVGPEDSSEVSVGAAAGSVEGVPSDDGQSKYRIFEELGRGGMGIVYRGEHVVLQKPVAIKVLYRGLGDDPTLRARLVLEARAACRARHRGIVDVTDYGQLRDGRAFIVMELVEGQTLEEVLLDGRLEPARALRYALQIARALRAAAKNGVVHRDLKPGNIFIDEEDQVKVGDFGVACVREPGADQVISADSEPDGSSHVVVGTAAYMAPEQARGEPVDVRSDIYALGCIFFEMLTGRMPYDAQHLMAMLNAQISEPVPALDDVSDPAVEPLAKIVRRAMAKRPDERFQTPTQLIDALERAEAVAGRADWRRWLPR